MSSWATLPTSWELEDVQAVLNVIITAFSGITVFVFTRCCWSLSARVAARGKQVSLSSLLTLNTPGEAVDILVLLKSHALRHWKILAQSFVVIALSLATVLSGPIAKYSTRLTYVVSKVEVDGLLAGRTDNSMAVSQVAWNDTQTSLDRAKFPLDQLLDYMPDTRHFWVYQPEEWNNTWSMSCKPTEFTPVNLTLTSNCSTFHDKFSGAMSHEILPSLLTSDWSVYGTDEFYVSDTLTKDILIMLYAANYTDWEGNNGSVIGTYRRIDMSLASVHLHHIPRNESDDDVPCRWDAGPVGSASYTRVDCVIKRAHDGVPDPIWLAFPDIHDVANIPSSLIANYFTRFKQESMADSAISVITPRDLQRFYQTYMITKDIQLKRPVKRQISVEAIAVQLSTGFIAIFALLALFDLVAGALCSFAVLHNRKAIAVIPQSKLDWLLQSIMSRATVGDNSAGRIPSQPSPLDVSTRERWQMKTERRRAHFEGAVYDTTWARDATLSPEVEIAALSPLLPTKGSDRRFSPSSWMPGTHQGGQE